MATDSQPPPYTPLDHSTLEPVFHQAWRVGQGTYLESRYPYGDEKLNGMEVTTEEGIQVVDDGEGVNTGTKAHSRRTGSKRRLCGIPFRVAVGTKHALLATIKLPTWGRNRQTESRRRLCEINFRVAVPLLVFLVAAGILGGAVGGVLRGKRRLR